MENNKVKETMNVVSITGTLVKNGLNMNTDKKGNEYIGGSLILRTADGSEHSVDYFSYKYKKDKETGAFTNEESGLYKGYETIIDEYKALDQIQEGELATVVEVKKCSFTDNIFMSQDGTLIENNKIKATFANRVTDDKIETTPQTASFQVSGVIKDIKDEVLKNGTMTGNKLIYLDIIGHEATITPVKLTVVKEMTDQFMQAGFYPMGTGKFAGKLVNTVEEYDEPQSFGEPIKRQRIVKMYKVTGGSPLGTLESMGITQEQYEAGKSKRRLKIETEKNKNNGQVQTGFTNGNVPNVNQTPTQQPQQGFQNPFQQQ